MPKTSTLCLRPATPLAPIPTIFDAFATHDIVALGDIHHDVEAPRAAHAADRRSALFRRRSRRRLRVRHAATPRRRLYRYLDGGDIAPDDLRRVSADGMFNAVWDFSPVYRQFFAAVREAQRQAETAAATHPHRARRAVAAHDASRGRNDSPRNDGEGAQGVARNRRNGTFRESRSTCPSAIASSRSSCSPTRYPCRRSRTSRAAGVSVFSIYAVPADELAAVQPDVARWPTPTLTTVAGTPLGAAPFARFAPTDTLVFVPDADGDGGHQEHVLPDPARSGSTQEQFDAVLVLAPRSSLPFGEASAPPID